MLFSNDIDMDGNRIAQGLVETAPTLVYIYDLINDRNIYISPQCRLLVGFEPAQIMSMGPLAQSLFHPDDIAEVRAHHARIKASEPDDKAIYAIEYRMRHSDGGWRWFASRERVHLRDGNGKPTQLLGAALDITDRIEREHQVKQIADTFGFLVRESPFGIYTVDEDLRITELSKGGEKAFSTVQPVIGRKLDEVIKLLWPEPLAGALIGRFQDTLRTGEPYVAPTLVEQRRDLAATESYDWQIHRITMPDGRLGVVCHFYDLSERNSFEEALEAGARQLKESEERLRLAQDYAGIGSWAWDHHADQGTVSESYRRLHGFAPDEPLTRARLLETMHEEDRDAFLAAVHHAVTTGERMEVEYRITLADGPMRWIRGVGQPIADGPLPAKMSMGTVEDITVRKLAEERLQNLNAELELRVRERTAKLEQANTALRDEIKAREAMQSALVQSQKLEALGQLTSGVAHDFNNVIAAISGGFEIIQRRSTDPRILEIARHGVAAAERGGKLVRQLTAFARQESLKPRAVAIADLLVETEPLLLRSAGQTKLLVDCRANLPPVRIDPIFLETALINLVINARDALGDHGEIKLTVAKSRPGQAGHTPEMDTPAVRVSVADKGCGMPPDVLANALDPFFTTKGPGKGTGLGLAMVHGFVRQSGGALTIDSKMGHGTRVNLFLPLAKETDVAGPLAGPVGSLERPSGELLRIVLAEDDRELRIMIGTLLKDWGHQVHEAEDAETAEVLLRQQKADLLITDVRMPERDGVELAYEVRQSLPDLPILFITGHADRARLDGERVLDKPFTPDALASAIASIYRDAHTVDRATHSAARGSK